MLIPLAASTGVIEAGNMVCERYRTLRESSKVSKTGCPVRCFHHVVSGVEVIVRTEKWPVSNTWLSPAYFIQAAITVLCFAKVGPDISRLHHFCLIPITACQLTCLLFRILDTNCHP